jgi:hypothetical protein
MRRGQSVKRLAIILLFLLIPVCGLADTLTHGSNFTISGSGFGTRTVYEDIFDNCTNASVGTLWGEDNDYVYTTPAALGRGVALPHTNITKYAAGHPSSWYGNSWLGVYVTGITYPTNLFCMAYRRIDPAWSFGSSCNTGGDTDNNFKMFTVSAGSGVFTSPYWYHDMTNQKCGLTQSWQNSFYSSGSLGSLNTAYTGVQGGSSDQARDPWYNWIKVEYRMGLGSSGQILKYLTNNHYYQNLTNMNTFDAGGSDGTFAIGVYQRKTASTQYNYMADIVMVVGPDAFKRVILSNNATYTSSTIVEYQPVVSWAAGSITVRGNVGAIPNGTAYLHVFVDASDTPVQTTAVTIGDSGGGEPGDTTPPTVTITTSDPQNVSTSSVSISWTDSDDTGVTARKWRIGSAPDASNGTTATSPATVTGLSSGANTVYIGAGDAAGNWGSDSITVNYTPPAIPPDPFVSSIRGRYLVDQYGDPILINGTNAWTLFTDLNDANLATFFADRQSRGVNAVIASLLVPASVGPLANTNGDTPFTTTGDFATPREAYFSRVDDIIEMAGEYGITLFIVPVYVGYYGTDEGWFAEMKTNGLTKCTDFGRYLGQRYASVPNIVWVGGGDRNPVDGRDNPQAVEYVRAVERGIMEYDTRIQSAHTARGAVATSQYTDDSDWLTLNAIYTTSIVDQHAATAYAVSPAKPFFLIEAYYEGDGYNATRQELRAQAYRAILGGACGQISGHALFSAFDTGWESAMASNSQQDQKRLNDLFKSKPWFDLVPDSGHTTITAGYGTAGTSSFVSAARTSDGSLVMAYLPSAAQITVDMTRIAGAQAICKWFNPATAAETYIGTYATTGTRTFTPATGDWVFIAEGETPLPTPSPTMSGATCSGCSLNVP